VPHVSVLNGLAKVKVNMFVRRKELTRWSHESAVMELKFLTTDL
jgi:hypothetical protein